MKVNTGTLEMSMFNVFKRYDIAIKLYLPQLLAHAHHARATLIPLCLHNHTIYRNILKNAVGLGILWAAVPQFYSKCGGGHKDGII